MQIFILNANIGQRLTTLSTENGNMKRLISYKCEVCKKRFQFPKGLWEHAPIHTGKNKYHCTNCRQLYNSLRAMKQHGKTHLKIEHSCDICSRTFKDQACLRQHRRGTHGRGWMALCGVVVDWPSKLHRHQKKCKSCNIIKEKKVHQEGN